MSQEVTERLKKASLAEAQACGRPLKYLNSSQTDKETIARDILTQDGVRSGSGVRAPLYRTLLEPRDPSQSPEEKTGVAANRHAPLSTNFHRSQADRCYPQRSALHRCPTHASDCLTNSRGRIDTTKKSLQAENILKVSSTDCTIAPAISTKLPLEGARH
jgi:hypothetical protein